MNRYCILVTIFIASLSSVSGQVKIENDVIDAERQTHYDILVALAKYYDLQLELTSPREAFDATLSVTIRLYNLGRVLKILQEITGMEYIVNDKKLIVGWMCERYNEYRKSIYTGKIEAPFDYLPFECIVQHSEYYNKKKRDSIFSLITDDPGYYINRAKKAEVEYIIVRIVNSNYHYLAHERVFSVAWLERELEKQKKLTKDCIPR